MTPISLLVGNWKLVAIGLLAAAVAGYVWHCERAKDKLAASIAIAEQQAVENAKQALRDIKAKERADENHERRIARLRADVKRLRDARPSLVPPAPASSGRPDLACFDRGAIDTALRAFTDGVAGLIEEGDAAIIGLDEAKAWSKNTAER